MPDTGIRPEDAEYLVTIAVQAHQFLFNGGRFLSGEALCAYRPDIRHGEIVDIGVGEAFAPNAAATLRCYVEAVQHTIEIIGDTVKRRTLITYSRGLLDERNRSVRFQTGGGS